MDSLGQMIKEATETRELKRAFTQPRNYSSYGIGPAITGGRNSRSFLSSRMPVYPKRAGK